MSTPRTATESATRFEYLETANVIARKDASRFRKIADPFGQRRELGFDIRGSSPVGGGFLKVHALESVAFEVGGEGFPAPARPVESRITAIAEALKSALALVFSSGVGDGAIVGLKPRQIMQQPGGTDVNCGKTRGGHGSGDRGVFDPRDDAISTPVPQPARRRRTATGFRQPEAPRPVLPQPLTHAVQQLPRVGVGSLYQQGDFVGAIHRVTLNFNVAGWILEPVSWPGSEGEKPQFKSVQLHGRRRTGVIG